MYRILSEVIQLLIHNCTQIIVLTHLSNCSSLIRLDNTRGEALQLKSIAISFVFATFILRKGFVTPMYELIDSRAMAIPIIFEKIHHNRVICKCDNISRIVLADINISIKDKQQGQKNASKWWWII